MTPIVHTILNHYIKPCTIFITMCMTKQEITIAITIRVTAAMVAKIITRVKL